MTMLEMAEIAWEASEPETANEEINEKLKNTYIDLPLAFNDNRHIEAIEGLNWDSHNWRLKERMKTVSVALVLCLNVGVDPPDIVKTQPCAKLECWLDPLSMSASKALEIVGKTLQAQYERWQPRARYKHSLDPTCEDIKKLCISLRRSAKEERLLFHYNGHGVPKPTTNGEIWVFNKNYTQYIPLSIYDLQSWMGSPSIYVYDCSNAGIIVEAFKTFAEQHVAEFMRTAPAISHTEPPSFRECIQLAACSANQQLPMNPDLPADVFTSCLTTPIKIALRWCVLHSSAKLIPSVTLDMVDKVPGSITDRKSMFGELNWIFTAITDTIAWNTLPRALFQKLFRQDLLVASIFRNYLLAERILKSCDCTPISSPALPEMHRHKMWNSWDLSVELCLVQLPAICAGRATFKNLSFFEDQLTAFEVWLQLGSENRKPPEQLPIVLQVLLSQVHRTRALELLGRFLDLGPWAVNLVLAVGIFPYVLKLLQSCAKELRPLLVYIWTKILAVDNTCQADLIREQGHKYFLSILQDPLMTSQTRTQAAFVLSCLVSHSREGQEAALQGSLVSICLEQLGDSDDQLRMWVAICLGRLWNRYEAARWTGVRGTAHERLYAMLKNPIPEVRAAVVFALGTFLNSVTVRSEHANTIDHTVGMALVNHLSNESSPLVRKEVVNALQWLLLSFDISFMAAAAATKGVTKEDGHNHLEVHNSNTLPRITNRDRWHQQDVATFRKIPSSPTINHMTNPCNMTSSYSSSLGTLAGVGYISVYMKIWAALCTLETDPYPEVSEMCLTITDYIRSLVREQSDSRNSSMSLPPSPNRMYLSDDSPPILHSSGEFQSRQEMHSIPKPRKISIDDFDEKYDGGKRPLVSTSFVAWSSKQLVKTSGQNPLQDPESKAYHERDWRRLRNQNVRTEAMEDEKRAISSKIESQIFQTKTVIPPTLLQLHPFSQQIAVAGNDSFAIWDWSTGAKTTVKQQKSAISGHMGKITSVEWINAHDLDLLMVGANDGSVRIWKRNESSSQDPILVSAWQAFQEFRSKPKGKQELLLAWEQVTGTAICTGDVKVLRFYDVHKELKVLDIPVGTDSPVTCLDSSYSGVKISSYDVKLLGLSHNNDSHEDNTVGPKLGLAGAGCADGSIRLFDRRCSPGEARVKVWAEHNNKVVTMQLKDNLVISGSIDGELIIYDIRNYDSLHRTISSRGGSISCMSIHKSSHIYALGSFTQPISIYTLNGTLLNTIRSYEGFMGHRIGPVNCITFHPLKVLLATGTSDCSVSIYGLENSLRR